MNDYSAILEKKQKRLQESGFDVEEKDLNPCLFDFQRHIVKRALKVGRYALFEDCGLGKTIQQLEWANQVVNHTGRDVLILCPLAVSGQTINEGRKFGIPVFRYQSDDLPVACVHISNYEQLDNIDCTRFAGVVLDESSILKNFTGETKKKLIEAFAETPYKLCCTATPSPNDLNEIGNHSEFLNILDAQDMRSKWFVRDEGMNNYRLKGHAKKDFYAWVSSWAVMLTKPSDIGFNATGYDLPPLNFIERQIKTPKRDNGKMFNDGAINATNFNAELRLTKVERLSEVADIVKRNISKAGFGKRHTEAHKLYMSNLYKGRPLDEETKVKISAAKKGVRASQETKDKLKDRGNRAVSQFDLSGNHLQDFKSAKEAGTVLGFWKSDITQNCMGNRKTVKGFVFRYL